MSTNAMTEGVIRRVVMSPDAWALAERAGIERLAQEHLRIRPELLGAGVPAHPTDELDAWRELVGFGVADCIGALSNPWTSAILQHLTAPIVVVVDATTAAVHSLSHISLAGNRALAVRQIREEHDGAPARTGVEVTFFSTGDLLECAMRLLPPYAVLRAHPAEGEGQAAPRSMMRVVNAGAALTTMRASQYPIGEPAASLGAANQARVTMRVVARKGTPAQLITQAATQSALWSGEWVLRDGVIRALRPATAGLVEAEMEPGSIAGELVVATVAAKRWLESAGRKRAFAAA